MDGVLDSLKAAKLRAIKGDFIDSLHSKVTVIFLFANLILIAIKQSADKAILCWLPTHFSGPQKDFAHQFCWINSTYWYGSEDKADKFAHSQRSEISYYQYIIFILSIQCVLFFLPALIWKHLISGSILFVNSSIKAANRSFLIKDSMASFKNQLENNKKNNLSNDFSSRSISLISEKQKKILLGNMEPLLPKGDHHTNLIPVHLFKFLTLKYLFLKLFYIVNLIFQFYFLSRAFKTNFVSYGIEFFQSVWHDGNQFFITKEFPILTLCDFFVHMPLNKQYENTIQCLLPVNILIERLYFLIWAWYVILFFLTIFNIISWCLEFVSFSKKGLVEKYLNISEKLSGNKTSEDENGKNINKFISSYLKNDGILLILLVKSVCGDIIFMEVLRILWDHFKKNDE